jgi:mediator of replication checkpoint protein 1
MCHRELLEQDDEAALKFHQGVVQGELRKKRKNRFGVEDSDEEDEEDDRARRIRRKMREKVERGDIQELGMISSVIVYFHLLTSRSAANEKTAAFANIYQSGLVDDEPIEVRPLDFNFDFQMGGEPGDDVSENDESEERGASNPAEAESDRHEYITYEGIRAEVQKMKEQPEVIFSVIYSI